MIAAAVFDVARWVTPLVDLAVGAAAGALPAVLGVLWGVMTLRRGLRRTTIE